MVQKNINDLTLSFEVQVSVIIPFYKNKKWLEEALDSVYNQIFLDFEIILVNDGSPEDIGELLTRYSQVKVITIENSGPGKARNVGIDKAIGKYIAFLDSDDLWDVEKLSIQVKFMNENNCAWSHSNYLQFWDTRNDFRKINCKMEGNIIPQMFLRCPIATPCVMIRSSILVNNVELRFSEVKRVGEDSYFWFKIAEKHDLFFIDKYLSKVRLRGKNAAFQAYLQLKSRSEYYDFIKEYKIGYSNSIHYKIVKSAFYSCRVSFKLVELLTKKLLLKDPQRELLSKVFFTLPYIYIKSIFYIFEKKLN